VASDYLHVIKNFNDKGVGEARKDGQERLPPEGDDTAAQSLKKSRYILTSSKQTLMRKDEEAGKGKIQIQPALQQRACGQERRHRDRHEDLMGESKLPFALGLIKEKLSEASRWPTDPPWPWQSRTSWACAWQPLRVVSSPMRPVISP